MDWYYGNEVKDVDVVVVVPKNYEESAEEMMISSPDSWSHWGITSDFTKNNFLNNTSSSAHEEEDMPKNFCTSMDDSISNNSTIYNNDASLADFQQFTHRINHMDDLFFSSLLEDYPTTKSSTEILGNDDINAFKRHASFSPSLDWDNAEVSSTTCLLPKFCQSQQYTSEQNSIEESVLQELERVTAQFTDRTRICFRDALYRLAESSKQPFDSCQYGEPLLTSNDDDTLRAGEREASESKTNAIDRAIANLMFAKMAFENNDKR